MSHKFSNLVKAPDMLAPLKETTCPGNFYLIAFRELWAVCTLNPSSLNQNSLQKL